MKTGILGTGREFRGSYKKTTTTFIIATHMDRVEADATPTEEWQQSLNAACNRLSTHYLTLLRSASSVSALQEEGRSDPRGKYCVTPVG